jgi:hypothetical protein
VIPYRTSREDVFFCDIYQLLKTEFYLPAFPIDTGGWNNRP